MQKRKILGINLGLFYKHPRFATQSIVNGEGTFKGMMEDRFTYRLDYDTCDLYDSFELFKNEALEEEFGLEPLGKHPQTYYKTAEQERKERYRSITESSFLHKYHEIINPGACYA
jgi:hypothetical protein